MRRSLLILVAMLLAGSAPTRATSPAGLGQQAVGCSGARNIANCICAVAHAGGRATPLAAGDDWAKPPWKRFHKKKLGSKGAWA